MGAKAGYIDIKSVKYAKIITWSIFQKDFINFKRVFHDSYLGFYITCIYKAKKTLPYLPYAPVTVLVTSRFRNFRPSALIWYQFH